MSTSTTEDEAPEMVLDDPSFPPPDGAELPAETEVVEEQPEDTGPPEPPQESREAMLSRENAEYRALLTQMQNQQQQQYRQPPPQQEDPYAQELRGLPPDQQAAWRESFKVMEPMIQRRIQAATAPFQDQMRQTTTFSESASLRQKHSAYGEVAPQIELARWQEYQRTGIWHPLELVYAVALGANQLQQPAQKKQQRQTERRRSAGQAAAATTVESQGSRVPAPKRTVEQTLAMSDEQILNMAEQSGGIERLRLPTRKRA